MNNDHSKLKSWILEQRSTLDEIIAIAGTEYHSQHQSKRYYLYDTNTTASELFLLNSKHDLCYDRPSIGFTYSLWYHGKRVNGLIDFFLKLILDSKKESHIEIFDLGAGTGAIQWVVGLVYEAMSLHDIPTPEIRIINIDSSPFMLDYNRDYLWKNFIDVYKKCAKIQIEYQINSWVSADIRDYTNVWLCASYLFDHSENQELIAQVFNDLATTYLPQKILLLSAHSKQPLVDSVGKIITTSGYQNNSGTYSREIFAGPLYKVNKLRKELNEEGLNFKGSCQWNVDTWYGKILDRTQTRLGIGFPKKMDIYQVAEKQRNKIELTPEQRVASKNTEKPTIIIGPAGCGKSVVLTEKVKNIVMMRGKEYDPTLNILLTTFNKDLVKYLGDWLEQILEDQTKFKRTYNHWDGIPSKHSYFTFTGSSHPNITVMHFDVLPTKIGGLRSLSTQPPFESYDNYHEKIMKKAVNAYVNEKRIDANKFASILNPLFLLDEYHRVIYGLQCTSSKDYLTVSREGRGGTPRLLANGLRRQIVAGCIQKYKSLLSGDKKESYIIRRNRFLKNLNRGEENSGPFTHVLIDELQDCCKADYDIFYALLKDKNQLTVAGDLAQSINIGTTARIPKPMNVNMSNFQKVFLRGSFRLPFRISQCIKVLSETIKEKFNQTGNTDVYEIIPYKGAPPGARPIIVKGNTVQRVALKIKEVFETYQIYDPHHINSVSIFETDNDLVNELNAIGIKATASVVQRTKGLEMPFVVWYTKRNVATEKEIEEFVYTILTRTTNILIVAVLDSMMIKYFDIINNLEKDRIILWDQVSENAYNFICDKKFDSAVSENEEDEEIDPMKSDDDQELI
jgi:DNA helicase-2/ATP-dependent DNA helicase PcrA